MELTLVLSLVISTTFIQTKAANLDTESCRSVSNCPVTHFPCKNGFCVSLKSLCDLSDNCGDRSDEEVCEGDACHISRFSCDNGKCINRAWVCYSGDHCGDDSDEAQCEPHKCHPLAFPCTNGQCISSSFFCNTRKDCDDNSDEEFCEVANSSYCPQEWTLCPYHKRCIPLSWKCNGIAECPGGTDELDCETNACESSHKPIAMPAVEGWNMVPDLVQAVLESNQPDGFDNQRFAEFLSRFSSRTMLCTCQDLNVFIQGLFSVLHVLRHQNEKFVPPYPSPNEVNQYKQAIRRVFGMVV